MRRLSLVVASLLTCLGNAKPNLGGGPNQILEGWQSNFGESIAIHSGLTLIGATRRENRGSVFVYDHVETPGNPWERLQIVKFTPEFPGWDKSKDSRFGASVALWNKLALAGAPDLGIATGKAQGAVYMFRKTSTGILELVTQLESPLPLEHQGRFGYSLAAGPSFFCVGEPDATSPEGVSNVGAVHIYTYEFSMDGTVTYKWRQTIYAPLYHVNAHFGNALALSGSSLLVGEKGRNIDEDGSILGRVGRVYLFKYDTDDFDYQQTLKPLADKEYLHFGTSIAVSNDAKMVAVGAVGDPLSDVYKGEAFVIDLDTGKVVQLVPSIGPAFTAADKFGHSVAISGNGDSVYVGATGEGGWGFLHQFSKEGMNEGMVTGLDSFSHALAFSEDDHYFMASDVPPPGYVEKIYIFISPNPPTTASPPSLLESPAPAAIITSSPSLAPVIATPDPTIAYTPSSTIAPTPDSATATPIPTPVAATPGPTIAATPDVTPEQTVAETPGETIAETPDATPEATPEGTPGETPDETPEETPADTPGETPEDTPSGSTVGPTVTPLEGTPVPTASPTVSMLGSTIAPTVPITTGAPVETTEPTVDSTQAPSVRSRGTNLPTQDSLEPADPSLPEISQIQEAPPTSASSRNKLMTSSLLLVIFFAMV